MSEKRRITVYIPEKLHEEAHKRKYNLSAMFSEYLEMELYQDNPEFVKKKIEELDDNHTKDRNVLLTKLKIAKERNQRKKDRLVTEEPEVWDYRTSTPIKKEKE